MGYEAIIKGGLHFDGTGAPGAVVNLGIRDGKVVAATTEPLDEAGCPRVIDARGKWVLPGFVDLHTHYDAELIAAPSLSESVRHGVTTVLVGSCSISAVLSDAEDCSDLFTRVESVPREQVLPLLRARKTWSSPAEYVEFLRGQPLGPNITTFLGHSDLRTHVMGLARAVDRDARPTEAELAEMERLLEDALDHGFLGLSTMTNPWDKLDGTRFRSAQLPSTYATWKEYRRLHRVLRRRGGILQSAPNIVTKVNSLLFLLATAGFGVRRALRTTLITLADAKSSRGLHRVLGPVTRFVNRVFRGDLRWQTLPVPFELYADGIDLVVFEEFGAGPRRAPPRRRGRAQRADAGRGVSPRVSARLREALLAPRVASQLPRRVRRRVPRCGPRRQVVRRHRREPRHPPRRCVPRSRGRARPRPALAHDDRQRSSGRARPADRRALRADRLRRLRGPHPQHGVLQRPAAHAALRPRARARRHAGDADREGGVATHRRDRGLARHRRRSPARRRSGRSRRSSTPPRSTRASTRITRRRWTASASSCAWSIAATARSRPCSSAAASRSRTRSSPPSSAARATSARSCPPVGTAPGSELPVERAA